MKKESKAKNQDGEITILTKKDYTKELEYLNNYLSEKAVILKYACKHLTESWKEYNIENEFILETKVIYYNKKFRMKVLVQSQIKGMNIIFYSRQDSISSEMSGYKKELKESIQDFILSVMGDFIERGMESLRREAIIDFRERTKPVEADSDIDNDIYQGFFNTYPMRVNEAFPKKNS